jgi:hypothetical protein
MLFSLVSCEKDEVSYLPQENKQKNNFFDEIKFDKNTFSSFYKKIEKSNRNANSYPTIGDLEHFSQLLMSRDSLVPYVDNMIVNYGQPLWNFAIQKTAIDNIDNRMIIIPVVKNLRVTAIIRYIIIENREIIEFISTASIYDSIFQNPIIPTGKLYSNVFNLLVFDFVISGINNESLATWVRNQDGLKNKSINNNRLEICISYTSSLSYYIPGEQFIEGQWWASLEFVEEIIEQVECFELSPGNGMPNGGGIDWDGFDPDGSSEADNNNSHAAEVEIAWILKRKECIEMSLANPEITTMMSSITMPCDDNEDILEDMVVKFCEDNIYYYDPKSISMTADDFEDALEGVDYIIEDQSLADCPFLKCLYNKLLEIEDSFICEYLSPSFDSESFELIIQVGDIDEGGFVEYNSETGITNMFLNENYCDSEGSNELLIVAKMLHEFVHAELYRQMLNAGLDPNEINSYYTFYNQWADWIYDKAKQQGTDEVHHHIMLEYDSIIDKIANALYNIYNGESFGLSINHFKWKAANGLFYAMELHSASVPGFYNLYGEFKAEFESLNMELDELTLSLGCI